MPVKPLDDRRDYTDDDGCAAIEIEYHDGAVHVILGQRRSHETAIGMPDAWIALGPADARRVADDIVAALHEIEAERV